MDSFDMTQDNTYQTKIKNLEEKQEKLEKEIADLRTSDRVTAPVRCPECKHVFHASVGEKNEGCPHCKCINIIEVEGSGYFCQGCGGSWDG